MMTGSSYLRGLAAVVAAAMFGVAAFNWLIDPFSLFDPPVIAGLNGKKPGYAERLRLTHVYRIERLQPDCVLLGTSRIGRGLRPGHPLLAGQSCYNAALPSASLYEMRRMLQHAHAVRPQKVAIVSLDFRLLGSSRGTNDTFSDRRLRVDANGAAQSRLFAAWLPDMTAALASTSATLASLDTVRRQSWAQDTLTADGLWLRNSPDYDHRQAFAMQTRDSARRFGVALREASSIAGNLDEFRLLVREAHARGTALFLLVPPSHAWHWQTLWAAGLWSRFEGLKRDLVRINDEEARRAARPPYPLWDFSGSYGPALEPLPATGGARMQWFWEPVHFTTALGDLVIETMLSPGKTGERRADGFGTPLTSTDLEPHLERLRTLQQDYAARHPADIDRIAQSMAKAPQ